MKRLRSTVSIFLFLGIYCSSVRAEELNLKKTPYGEKLSERLSYFVRIGNNGSTDLKQLKYNTDTYDLSGTIEVRVSHSWGKIVWTDYAVFPPKDRKREIEVSAKGEAAFVFNLRSKDLSVGTRIPLGERSVRVLGKRYSWNFGHVGISADQMRRALDGDLTALVETIPTLGAYSKQHENDYHTTLKRLQAQYGKDNVYLASKQFVDRMKPSQVGNYVISLIATGGAIAPAIIGGMQKQFDRERSLLSTWFRRRAISNGEKIAADILDGKGVTIPHYHLTVKWITIDYRNRSGLTVLPMKYASEGFKPITPWIKESHGAFYVLIKARTQGQNPQVDSRGFDADSLSGDDFPERRMKGRVIGGVIQPSYPSDFRGMPAADHGMQFQLKVVNDTGLRLRIAILRGGHPEPVHWSRTLKPGEVAYAQPGGVSERVVGVWDREDGSLLLVKSLAIDKNMHIAISYDPVNRRYWISDQSR